MRTSCVALVKLDSSQEFFEKNLEVIFLQKIKTLNQTFITVVTPNKTTQKFSEKKTNKARFWWFSGGFTDCEIAFRAENTYRGVGNIRTGNIFGQRWKYSNNFLPVFFRWKYSDRNFSSNFQGKYFFLALIL